MLLLSEQDACGDFELILDLSRSQFENFLAGSFMAPTYVRPCNTVFAAIVALLTDEMAFYPSALNM